MKKFLLTLLGLTSLIGMSGCTNSGSKLNVINLTKENILEYVNFDVKADYQSIDIVWRVEIEDALKLESAMFQDTVVTINTYSGISGIDIKLNKGGSGHSDYFTYTLSNTNIVTPQQVYDATSIINVVGTLEYYF